MSNSLGRPDQAVEYYKQALDFVDRMTDREKFRTRGGYYLLIRDLDKAREQFEALVKQFPADSTGLSNLAVVAAGQRDMAGALEIGRRASAIYPNNVLRRNNVALFALYGGDFGNAEKLATDWKVPVTEGVAYRTWSCGPRATAQNLVLATKENLGVLLIWEGFEARVGIKVCCGPLPDIPNHAQYPVRARPLRICPHLCCREGQLI